MKRRCIAAFAAILAVFFLTASIPLSDTTIPTSDIPLIDAPTISADTRYILVEQGADPLLLEAAAYLAERLSGGLAVEEARFPHKELHRDDVVLILLDGGAHSNWCSSFQLLSLPFLYTDYDHYTMALNSKPVQEHVAKELAGKNSVPLAAFYGGSDFLLSRVNLDDPASLVGTVVDGESFPDPESIPLLLARSYSVNRAAYEKAGAMVQTEPSRSLRIQKLKENTAQIAEFSFAEPLSPSDLPIDELFFTRSWQSTRTYWLLADSGYYDSLSPSKRAELKEAVAALFPRIDKAILQKEDNVAKQLVDNRVILSRDFSKTRALLNQYIQRALPPLSLDEQQLLAYLSNL